MPLITAIYNKEFNEYYCGAPDCGKLLFTGEVVKGRIEKKCKCGNTNVVEAGLHQQQPGAYQDRMGLTKK